MNAVKIHIPTPEEEAQERALVLAHFREQLQRQREAVETAKPALLRLVLVMKNKTGQSYKIRSMLYSLWNGQPVSLSEVCNLDMALRVDLCAVVIAWGYGRGDWEFFYDEIRNVVSCAGLWPWFLEAETIAVTY